MKYRKGVLCSAGIAVLLLAVVPYVLPLEHFIPEIERLASEQLKAQVKVDSLRLSILPRPQISVMGIVVGKKPFLQVTEVVIVPRLLSLFGTPKVISKIRLRDVVIGQALIAKASGWASRGKGNGPAAIRVEHVEVRDAFMNLTALRLRNIDVDLDLAPDGGLALARLRADQAHLEATLLPRGRNFNVEIAAREWKLPAGPALLMSSLAASGTLDPRRGLTLTSINGRLYDGSVSGDLNIGWADRWSIAGHLAISNVAIQPVVALYTRQATISGRLSANPVLDMQAPSAGELGASLNVESDFKVEQGVLYNIDLGNAPKAVSDKEALNSGQTRFDDFTGHLAVDADGYYLTDVKIGSGVLAADAQVWISPKQELAGQIDVALKGTSGIISTPLSLGGTVQNPTLYPSKAALAGAAAGTMLLGPVLGTTVGMKAARFTQKLFGPKRPKKKTAKSEPDKPSADPAAPRPNGQTPAVHTGR